ncbi:MAG: hypothetical protein A3F43_01715 [Gammaproteobacteria bacterium RIFCSPHIGHO2_12_FULL_42_10]|nr:MAG: hypothetical protein A3F43_01715 [Gammaproteobacteria bacterium RIFCSPHIGHO2_12_FULL_42_10]
MPKKSLTNKSGQVKELTSSVIRAMKPASEVLPKKLLDVLPKRKRGERGPQKREKKIQITQRYKPEIVRYFKATGEGWQTRIEQVLEMFIDKHPKYPRRLEHRQQKQPRSAA